jgi:hypothetical protein
MDKTILKESIEKYKRLDEASKVLINSHINILLARQEMEKGVSDNVAQGNSDIRKR